MKKLAITFGALAALLSNVMCFIVAYAYCDMLWGIKHAGYSAPAWVAFLYAIPFVLGIAIFVILSIIFWRKSKSI